MVVTEKATISAEEWRKQINYKRTDGWRVIAERGNGNVAIEKDTRTRDDNTSMTMRDRHDKYRRKVKVEKDYTYLHKHAIPKSLTSSDYDDIYKTGRDRRKQYYPRFEEEKEGSGFTRDGSYD
nr:MAG: hypothetical protein [Lokiarchaeota virus Ratatoskr Meg22_1012]